MVCLCAEYKFYTLAIRARKELIVGFTADQAKIMPGPSGFVFKVVNRVSQSYTLPPASSRQ